MFLTGMGSGGRVFLVALGGWVVIQVQTYDPPLPLL